MRLGLDGMDVAALPLGVVVLHDAGIELPRQRKAAGNAGMLDAETLRNAREDL